MPELAEVEFYRKQWNCGAGHRVRTIELHEKVRVFRDTNTTELQRVLVGARLLSSWSHGKQMLFQFSRKGWLGVHLGMSGKLWAEKASFAAGKHDHLVLRLEKTALVFTDPRQFGRILFHSGNAAPGWWTSLPPDLFSSAFDIAHLENFLARHRKAPIKAVLLMQDGFPGIGNWMADEILWQAGIHPRLKAGKLNETQKKQFFKSTRLVSAKAMQTIGQDYSDPPESWLFSRRWTRGTTCPKCKEELMTETIGGRTTCWCPRCQP